MCPWLTRRFDRRPAGRFGQRCGVLALLAIYVLTAAGVPLPKAPVARISGELYPCASCGCGCASANQCWTSCCCHSLAERLAWARHHGVRPPAFALAEARQAGIDLSWLAGEQPATPTCCVAKTDTEQPPRLSCCSRVKSCCQSTDRTATDEQPAAERDFVIGWRALACGGHSHAWLAAVPTMIRMGPELSCDLDQVEWLGPTLSEVGRSVGHLPAIPPPQCA